jgi:hypothetical protein
MQYSLCASLNVLTTTVFINILRGGPRFDDYGRRLCADFENKITIPVRR